MPDPFAELLPYFPDCLRQSLAALPLPVRRTMEEIRLRVGRPVMVTAGGQDVFAGPAGALQSAAGASVCDERAAALFLEAITRASLYACEEQVRQAYLTLPGGHRVGLAGEAVMQEGEVRTIKHIAGFNIRLARQVPGAADAVLPRLVAGGRLLHTLVVSPPGCGKTTLLRDLTRQIANGAPDLGLPGQRVAVADERFELAACYRGVPQLDVGWRTDVLAGCPKTVAVMLLLRAMNPQVIVTDEIGSAADAAVMEEALHGGVTLLASAHGSSLADVSRRPGLARLLGQAAFARMVVLSRRNGPGTVEEVCHLEQRHPSLPVAVRTGTC